MAKKVVEEKKAVLTKKLAKKLAPLFPKAVNQPKGSATLVSFTVSAVIPTQQYGNIQPKIEVTAGSIEDARAIVMPVIEDLYKTYAEMPLSGKEPKFYGKITEEVKIVTPAPVATPAADKKEAPAPEKKSEAVDPPKSDAVLKAEKAIKLAMSPEAVEAIQDQIQKSVKIAPEDKPALYTVCLQKKKELKK